MRSLAIVCSITWLITGCDLYWGGGQSGDDVVCHTPPAQEFRDPNTGTCQPYGGGGPGGCEPCYCGDCPPCVDVAPPDQRPEWPSCYGACSGLDEASCEQAPGCHATFVDPNVMSLPPTNGPQFWECWEIAPLPVQQGYCEGLDAYSCAMHDDCVGYFGPAGKNGDASVTFYSCGAESTGGTTCANVDCGYGSHCEDQCYPCDSPDGMGCPPVCQPMCVPDGQTCASVDCGPGYQCVETCDAPPPQPMPNGPAGSGTTTTPPGYCYPTCVQITNDPGECYGDVWCGSAPPVCPATTTPGVLAGCYSGYCIPVAQCGPMDPGTCEPASCTAQPPACPADTTAGTKNGCYTGYCIPNSACPQVPCEALTTEQSCTSRMECTPVYTGTGCTCTPNTPGCTCQVQTYDHCETWWWPNDGETTPSTTTGTTAPTP